MLSARYTSAFLPLLLFAVVGCNAADIGGAVNGVDAQASSIKGLVDQWSSADGLQGALSIQDQFPSLSQAVASLSQAAGSVTEGSVDPSSIQSLASSITSLLQSLSQKASDFKGVGASDIVANDISSLKQPAVDIINNFAKAVSQNCEKASSLDPALHNIAQGFSSADAKYNLPPASFPASVECAGNKAVGSTSSQPALTSPTSSVPAGPQGDTPVPDAGSQNSPIAGPAGAGPTGASPSGLLSPGLEGGSPIAGAPAANAPNNNTIPVVPSNGGIAITPPTAIAFAVTIILTYGLYF